MYLVLRYIWNFFKRKKVVWIRNFIKKFCNKLLMVKKNFFLIDGGKMMICLIWWLIVSLYKNWSLILCVVFNILGKFEIYFEI